MQSVTEMRTRDRQSVRDLFRLVLGLAFGGLVLVIAARPPHLPAELPSWSRIGSTLQGSDIDALLPVLGYVLTTAAWFIWFWLAGSLCLHTLVVLAEALARGAAWVRLLRNLSNRVSAPIVRRLVEGALVAAVVVNIATRTVPVAAAAPVATIPAVHAEVPSQHGRMTVGRMVMPALIDGRQFRAGEDGQVIMYTVQPGDTLWSIAERFYGTGYEFRRLVEANAGRLMPDGRTFTRAGVIYPGWVLRVPLPKTGTETANGQIIYTVEPGDTLRGIAARFLGDEMRWTDIYALNRGVQAADGRAMNDPDLIWPGLQLTLPQTAVAQKNSTPPAETATPALPIVQVTADAGAESARLPAAQASADAGHEPARQPNTQASAQIGSEPTPVAPVQTTPAPSAPIPAPVNPGPAVAGAITAAALAAGGVAIARQRRQVRRSLRQPPVPAPHSSSPAGRAGFVETEFSRTLAHLIQGSETDPAMLVAQQAMRFCRTYGLSHVAIVYALRQDQNVTLTLQATLSAQERLLALAEEFGRVLGGTGSALVTQEHDIALTVARGNITHLITPLSGERVEPLWFLPLGQTMQGAVMYANWNELGPVMVAGMPGSGTDIVLTSLICALAARNSPQELRLWTIASPHRLPVQVERLPHQQALVIDPADTAAVTALLAHVRGELEQRMRTSQPGSGAANATQPALVLLVDELGAVPDEGTTLDLIALHGPAYGIHLLAATTQAGAIDGVLLDHFATRLVLQMQDDDESIRVLGQPGAADLRRGELLVRLAGRSPLRIRGFRVSEAHLEHLLQLMIQEYGTRNHTHAASTRAPLLPNNGRNQGETNTVAQDSGTAVVLQCQGEPVTGSLEAGSLRAASDAAPLLPGSGRDGNQVHDLPGEGIGPIDAHPDDAQYDAGTSLRASNRMIPGDIHVRPGNGRGGPMCTESQPIRSEEFSTVPSERDAGDPANARQASYQLTAGLNGNAANDTTEAIRQEAAGENSHGRVALASAEHESGDPVILEQHDVHHECVNGAGERAEVHDETALPIRVLCLGGFVVRSGDRILTASGDGRQAVYKAWELLAFLAVHPAGGVARERLLAALWPDADADQAGKRMHVTMSHLRDVLEKQVPELAAVEKKVVRSSRGAGICRLEPSLIWSDAQEFLRLYKLAQTQRGEAAIRTLEQMRALYHGPLLSGPALDRYPWLDERLHGQSHTPVEFYRDMYYQASQELARHYAQAGRVERAIELCREILKAEPIVEDVVRDLYAYYGMAGDLPALMREDLQLRENLRKAYADPDDPEEDLAAIEPEAETVARYKQIRRALEQQRQSTSASQVTAGIQQRRSDANNYRTQHGIHNPT